MNLTNRKRRKMLEIRKEMFLLRQENKILRQYVEPEVLETLTKSKEDWLGICGKSAEVSVMFLDIRNFTPMAEKFPAEVVVEILNRFLSLMSEVIVENGGTLDKYIGDAVMCFWNSPFPQEDYVFLPVKTALEILERLKPVVAEVEERYAHSVSVGVGIHCGKVVAGNIGSAQRLDFTVVGDVVNTAARLESNAKNGKSILISSEVYQAVESRVLCEKVEGGLSLKGKDQLFDCYLVKSLK